MRRRFLAPLLWLVAAAIVHLLAAAAWQRRPRSPTRPPAPQPAPVQLMTGERLRQARARARPTPKRETEPPPPDKGRIVSLPPPAERQLPRNSDRLAAHDHRAERETISRHRRLEDAPAAERPTEPGRPAPVTPTAPPPPRQAKTPRRAREGRRPSPAGPSSPRDAEALPLPRGPLKLPSLADLLPSAAALAQQQAGAPVADVSTADAEEGEVTALNARAFRYASFFERVSQRLRRHWHVREAVERLRRRGRALVEHETHKTLVHVVLGADGGLVSASVIGRSGFDELDDAGTQAFVAAAPFLHPPKGLLAGRDQIAFDFEFALSVEASSLFGGLDWQQMPP